MPKKAIVPEIVVSGSFNDMGAKAGEKAKAVVRSYVADAKARLNASGPGWDRMVKSARVHVHHAQDYSPDYFDYLQGYAEGSGVPFADLYLLISEDEKGLCTDVAVNGLATADGSVLSAHTEDWRPADRARVMVLRARPKTGPSFLAATHAGLEWISGVNSAGLSVTGNSLYMNDARVGFPKMFMAPKILSSKTTSEAIAAATDPGRGSTYNFNICHSSGEIFSVEGSATDFAIIYGIDGYLVHTNHYLHPKMARFENVFGPVGSRTTWAATSTIVRYDRALKLIRSQHGEVTSETMKSILRDHVDRPGSICRHPDPQSPPHDQSQTNYAVLLDPKGLRMELCLDNPCKGTFVPFELG